VDYYAPTTLDEVLDLLARYGEDATLLAGGQSLMPLINMRLAAPTVLVDLNGVQALDYLREDDGGIAVGALTRDRTLEGSGVVRRRCPLLAEAAANVGYPSIRARATMGGTFAQADPAGELPTVAVALDATVWARRAGGERTIRADEFFLGPLTTALEPNEVVVEVRWPALPPGSGWAFLELAPRPGDYALVGVAALVTLDADACCTAARLAYTAVGATPLRAPAAERALIGRPLADAALAEAGALAAEAVEPEDESYASAAYKREMAAVYTRRALRLALERVRGAAGQPDLERPS
jgi:aerobic carbon-monoxide dehydrogenase medium subunit